MVKENDFGRDFSCLFFMMSEFLLRISHGLYVLLEYPAGTKSIRHPVYGWKSVPLSLYQWTHENKSSSHMNAAGWRDSEYSIVRRDEVYCVIILGNSFVEALQIDLADTFHKLLDWDLNRKYEDKNFEVMAMGVNGYSTALI